MFFKRPITTNNFSFSDWSCIYKDYEEGKRREEHFASDWTEIMENPIYFWYLMLIFEISKKEMIDHKLFLVDIWEINDFQVITLKFNEEIWNNEDLQEILFTKNTYAFIVYHIARLASLFFAFDIKSLSIVGDPHLLSKDLIRWILSKYTNGKTLEDDDCDMLYKNIWELGKMERIMIENVRESLQNKYISLEENFIFEVFPSLDCSLNRNFERWEKIKSFWKFMYLELDFDSTNLSNLQELLNTYISAIFDTQNWGEISTIAFTAVLKKSKIVWNTAFIAFKDIVDENFQVFQYLYWLEKQERCTINSWKLQDSYLIVKIYDPILCNICGIKESFEKFESIMENVVFNMSKQQLELKGERLLIWESNESYLAVYFDLFDQKESWVAMDDILDFFEEGITPKDHKYKKLKNSLFYDKAKALSKKINKVIGIPDLFYINYWYIKLKFPIRIEK